MKITKEKVNFRTRLVNPIIELERLSEKILKRSSVIIPLVTVTAVRSTSPITEKDDLKNGIYRKTNYSRLLMVKASVLNLERIRLL